jgi:thiamine biosynthesis lipoprotein
MIPTSARVLWRFEAIGTIWEIETDAELGTAARMAVEHAIAEFDRDWSRFRPDSLVSALARGAGVVPAPVDAADMFALFAEAAEATDGAVNPLVGASLEHLGYDSGYSFRSHGPLPAPRDWRERLAWTGDRMMLTEPAMIDVGALGKGRLVDIVLDIVAQWTEGDVVVDASGDIAVRGTPVRIALEHPFDPNRAIGVVEIADAALCASAVGRRAWGDGLHHVLDARSGLPVRTIAATWAISDSAMRADAAATALFFDGGPELAARWGVEWVRMTTDGRVEWSPAVKAELFM